VAGFRGLRAWGSIAVLWAIALTAPSSASAQELGPQPEWSLSYGNATQVRINPNAVVNVFRTDLRYRLLEHESDFLNKNYVSLGVTGGITPAWGRVGVQASIQPLSLLKLYVRYSFYGYFGTLNLLASFDSADADFSDTALSERADQPGTENYATIGGELILGSRLRLKIGPIVARNSFRAYYVDYQLQRGDPVYYEITFDILLPNQGWMLTDDTDIVWVSDFGLAIGARWHYAHSFYADYHYAGGVTPPNPPNNDIHRIGPFFAYTFNPNPGGRLESMTALLLANWYVVHRFRTGLDSPTAFPFIALAFAFEGDLLADH